MVKKRQLGEAKKRWKIPTVVGQRLKRKKDCGKKRFVARQYSYTTTSGKGPPPSIPGVHGPQETPDPFLPATLLL